MIGFMEYSRINRIKRAKKMKTIKIWTERSTFACGSRTNDWASRQSAGGGDEDEFVEIFIILNKISKLRMNF
jgi:hypothetical protein